mmetsp:Transcript_9113/g.41364  ORF Transcript_9113/g.41364 Transcript_9113/m.41364 type:complete len:227 (-) Transcript_9113:2194-2874(-)
MRWSRSVSSRMCAQPSRMLSPYLDATVNAVTAAVRARSSFPNNTDGFTLSPDATVTALFPSSEAYGGDANLHKVPTSESTTSVSLWCPATRATPRNPSSASFNTESSTGCSNTTAMADTVGDHTMPKSSPSYMHASSVATAVIIRPLPVAHPRTMSFHLDCDNAGDASVDSSLISSVAMASKMYSKVSRGQSEPPLVPRLLRTNCSRVILFLTCGLCWSVLSMMME